MPLLVMVAGPNGSGKSTLISALRADAVIGPNLPAVYVNADDIQRETGFSDAEAQRAAAELRARALAERRDVMYETVMSHPSKLAELQQARAAGYEVHVMFLATKDPSINVQRVALRVTSGGHNVPEDRTRQRYKRTLALAPVALGLADQALVYDNSIASVGIQLQAQLVGQRLELMVDRPAKWVTELATRVNERADDLARIQERAYELGVPLQSARITGGKTEGPIEILGSYYAAQRDLRSNALVLHDIGLLSSTHAMEHGRSYCVGYSEGVSDLQCSSALEQQSATSSRGRD